MDNVTDAGQNQDRETLDAKVRAVAREAADRAAALLKKGEYMPAAMAMQVVKGCYECFALQAQTASYLHVASKYEPPGK